MSEKLQKLKPYLKKYGVWFFAGLIIACFTIGGAIYWAISKVPPESLHTPQYMVKQTDPAEVTFDLQKNKVYSADDGIVVIEPALQPASAAPVTLTVADPEEIWENDQVVTYNSYTLPEKVEQADGSLGVLSIPDIGVSVNIFEAARGEEMEAMTKGLAHFSHTTSWDGNIGLCGHNINFDLTDGYFKDLYTLAKGSRLTYSTSLGERAYEVQTIKTIAEDDWSYLGRTSENKVTMITCISGQPTKRLMVQAVEIKK